MKEVTLTIQNKEGLHARPASIFVNTANAFQSKVTLIKNHQDSKRYEGKSILSVMSMAAAQGDQVTLRIEGEDEAEMLQRLQQLFESNFEELT